VHKCAGFTTPTERIVIATRVLMTIADSVPAKCSQVLGGSLR
jgi:hypothetical protein